MCRGALSGVDVTSPHVAKGATVTCERQSRQTRVPAKNRTDSPCARIWTFLTRIDAAEAERCRLEGCPRCGGCLDGASYPRKPHGLAASLREGVRRFSFCCRDCRRRETPSSVRFFGRRFRVAPVFLAASFLVQRGGFRLTTVSECLGIPVSTLRRWRRWWREMFPKTRAWRLKRGELAPPPGEAPQGLSTLSCLGSRSIDLRLAVNVMMIAHNLDREMPPANYQFRYSPLPSIKPRRKLKGLI